jgi:4-amino-4-deoxy-L-arabinose transferase-like glycosyltransferase
MAPLMPGHRRWRTLLAVLLLGLLLFVWRLGQSGLVDETPPLFAASARAMAEQGDWLVPQVNGLPRYDKPPLIYWLIGALHSLPGRSGWDPLGSWASNLPSALATVALMLLLADTLLRYPQATPARPSSRPSGPDGPTGQERTAVAAALAFALSPLVLLWGRIGVSDALFSATLGAALLCSWRCYAAPTGRGRWWQPWLTLALAVLTKGPVAVVLLVGILGAFGWWQRDLRSLLRRLRPLPGLALLVAVSLPWYGLTLAREGQPFWDSFFGYHNLQRFTSVVNNHLQPWWYYLPLLLVASLPVAPLLLLGLARALGASTFWGRSSNHAAMASPRSARWPARRPWPAQHSLAPFAACWLLGVLTFFTLAATKLPSYWLPATPAAALLITLTGPLDQGIGAVASAPDAGCSADADGAPARSQRDGGGTWPGVGAIDQPLALAWGLSLLLTLLLGGVFLAGPLWVKAIQDPELPTLPAGILASGRLPLAAACWLLAAGLGWLGRHRPWPQPLLRLQLPLVAFVPLALLPLWNLGDQLRGAPVRAMAAAVQRQARPGEPLAMVGILKPSLHYYSRRVVIYEGDPPVGPVNLADRLRQEFRPGQSPSSPEQRPTLLLVIDRGTAALPHWRGLEPTELASSGLYRLWRVERRRLEQRADSLQRQGLAPTWQLPRPERY